MGIRVGIDLGTTFSAVAWVNPQTGKAEVIKNSFGSPITPSVLCFQPDGSVLFGEVAKEMQAAGDPNTMAFFKRSMGNENFVVEFFGKRYTVTDLSAILLRKLKEEAESRIGQTIDEAVITVPAYFTHKERTATIQAGEKAGLRVNGIINEPTAATLAYGLNQSGGNQTVLVYDLGGGTFDVTIARVTGDEIVVLGSDGNHELGGKDWDDCIARYLNSAFLEEYGVNLAADPEKASALLVTAENAKKQLTSRDVVKVPLVYRNTRGTVEITEEIFEEISQFLLGTTRDVTQRLLDSLKMTWSQLDGVILVGGSTRMRMIHKYVMEMSGRPPLSGVNVDEAVALGAAIRANITDKGETLGLSGGTKSRQSGGGLAVMGAKAITDVTAHSLGMVSISQDGERYINKIIIPKNTRIPAENSEPFHLRTRRGNNELEIYVLQGEYSRPLDNTVIHKYVVSEIQPAPPPGAVIQVTYHYTANGVVEVGAVQQETGKQLPVAAEPVPEDMSWTDLSPKENQQNEPVNQADVVLAIDLSGSMIGEPIAKAKTAMKEFVSQMEESGAQIGLVAFADSVEVTLRLTEDYQRVYNAIDVIDRANVGGGNDVDPFPEAYDLLKKHHKRDRDRLRYVVVLTDGQWYAPEDAIRHAQKCHAAGMEVIALGFGTADYDFLEQIASASDFAALTDVSQLSNSFSKIAQVIGSGATGLRV